MREFNHILILLRRVQVLVSLFALLCLVPSEMAFAQVTGDYQSAATGTWTTLATWERWNGAAWATPTAGQGYPGQNTAGAAVLIRNTHTVTLNVSPVNVVGTLTVGEGTTGTLQIGNSNVARTINISGDVTVASGGSVVVGNFNQSGHNFNFGGNLTVDGTLDLNLDGNSRANATMNGAGPQSISGAGATVEFYILTINAAGTTKTLSRNIAVTGNLTVTAGTFDLGTFTANRTAAGGILTVAAGGTLQIGGTNSLPANYTTYTLNVTSTVEYYGSSQTVNAVTYGNLSLTGSGPKTTPTGTTTTTVAGSFSLASGITYERAAGATSTLTLNGTTNTNDGMVGSAANPINTINVGNAGGDIFTNNGTINVATALGGTGNLTQGTNAILNIGGTSGITTLTATADGNTVTYNGTGAQNIKATTYHHLTLSNGGVKTAPAALTVNGDFTIDGAASFTAGTFTHNFGGNWIVNTSAVTPLTVTTTSAINFNTPGTPTATSIGGTTTATIAFADLNVNNTSGLNINENVSFQTGTTPTLTVGANATLTPAVDVIISGTGTLTGTGTVKVTRTAATPDFNSQYTIATKTLTALTVDYDATAAQTVNTLNYFNLAISGNRGGTTVTMAGPTIGIAGSFSPNATNVVYSTTGNTVNYNGTGTQTVATFAYNDVTISNTTNPVGAASNFDVAGTMTVNANAIFLPDAAVVINNSAAQGTLTGAGTVRVTRTTATADFLNQYKFTTYTLTALTVDYYSTGAQTVNALTYGNLWKSLSGTATLENNVTVGGNLTVNTGTLDLSSYTANGTGTLNLTAGGTLRIGGTNTLPTGYGTYTLTAGTVEYYGSTQEVSAVTYGNLILSGSGPKTTPTGTTTTTVAGNFTLGSGITYERAVGATSNLTLNGTTNTNDGMLGSPANPFNTLTVGDGAGDILTNNGTIRTETALSGTGSLTQGTNSSLYIGGTSGITTLTATASPNTVIYNGTAAQAVNATTFHNLIIANGAAVATIPAITVNNDFTISGGTATIGAVAVTVSGTTTVTGTLNITSNTGAKAFNDLTVNSGGVFNNSGNAALTINGNITNDGTLTAGTGVYTLAGTTKTISGSAITAIPSISLTGSYTNLGILDVNTALTGAGSFENGANATVTIATTAANFTVATFIASADGNIVDYDRLGAQTIVVPSGSTYHHLRLSQLGAKTAAGGLTVNGNLIIQGTLTSFAAGAFTHTFYGNWELNNSLGNPFTMNTSTIVFDTPSPAASTSLDGTTTAAIAFYNLTINNSNGFNANENITVSTTLTVQSGATLIPDAAITVGGTGALTGGGTVKVTGASFNTQYTITTPTLTNLTVDYDASSAQTVNAGLNYYNLIIRQARDANNVTLEAGTIGVSGTFSPLATFGAGGYVTSGNTIDFNGTAAQTIPAFSYNNLTSSSTGDRALASSGSIGVAGTFAPGTNIYTGITGSTIDYNGGGAQTIAAFNYNNLTLSNAGVKTFASLTSRIAGNLSIAGSATVDATTNTPTIEFNGTSQQTCPPIAFHNLTVNNAAGMLITGGVSVAGTLTFTNGTITTGANKVSILNGATASGASSSSYVVGNFEKYVSSVPASFEVGTAGAYTPVDVIAATGLTAGTLTVTTVSSDHPEILSSGIEASKSVNRYWTLTGGTIAFTTYDARFNFQNGDKDGGTNTSNFIVDRYSGGTWTLPTTANPNANSTDATGLTAFGDFQIGEPSTSVLKTWDGGASTGNWEDGNNWNPDGVPTSSNNVSLTGATTININSAAECNSITLNNSGLTLTIQSGSLTASGGFSLVSGTFAIQTSFPTVSGTISITGGTVSYSGGNQPVRALTYHHLTLSGTATKDFEDGSTEITGDFSSSGGITVDATNTTINFSGGAQAVAAINYNNITFSNPGTKTFASSGTTGIAGTFSIGGGASASAPVSSTVNYNGSSSQNIQPINYYHLTLSNSGSKIFLNAPTSTTGIAGDFSVSGGSVDATTNSTTVDFNGGAGTQAVAAMNYYNLTLSNAGTKRFASGTVGIANVLSKGGSVTVDAITNASTVNYNGSNPQTITQIDYHDLALNASGEKTFAANTNIAGDFVISGSASANVSTNSVAITYNGTTGAQVTPVLDYVGLTINNSAGIDINGSLSDAGITLSGVLTLTSGNIRTNTYHAYSVKILSTGSVSRTSGHIVGNLEKYYPGLAATTRTYEIGDASAYTRVDVTFNPGLSPAYLSVSTTSGDHPQIITSGINSSRSVNRYYTFVKSISGGTINNATFYFDPSGDIDPTANYANFEVRRYKSGAWSTPTIGTRNTDNTQITGGIGGDGDFQIGEPGTSSLKIWSATGSGDWNVASNWSPNGIPDATNDVSLTNFLNPVTINIPDGVSAACNSITLNSANLTLSIISGGSLSVAGDLTITNAALNTEASFPAVTGAITINGGTVNYNSSGSQNVTGATYNNLTLSGGGTKTAQGNITVNGNFTNSVTVAMSSNTLTLNLSGTNTNSGTVQFAGAANGLAFSDGTVEYDGAGAQAVAAGTYNNLTLSNSGTKTLAGSISSTGNLTISGGIFDLGAFTADRASAGGTLNISNGATLKIGGTNDIPGNYSTHIIGATSTIEYSGSDQSVIALNSSQDYGHLTISGTGTKTLAASIAVSGNLNISASTLDDAGFQIIGTSGGTMTMAAGTTFSLGSASTGTSFPMNFTNANITLNNASTVVYNSNQSQTVSAVPTYGNLTLTNSGMKTISSSFTVQGAFTLNSGSSVTVDNTAVLQINGDLITDGALTNNGTINIGN